MAGTAGRGRSDVPSRPGSLVGLLGIPPSWELCWGLVRKGSDKAAGFMKAFLLAKLMVVPLGCHIPQCLVTAAFG